MNYYGGYGYGMTSGFGFLDVIWHVIVIFGLIWLLIWVFRSFGMGGRRSHRLWQMHSAVSILDERFAKGEIDKTEYEERKKALMS
jgi:putative membrane protein